MKTLINCYKIIFLLGFSITLGFLFIRISDAATTTKMPVDLKIDVETKTKEFSEPIKNVIMKENNLVINFENHAVYQIINNPLSLEEDFKKITQGEVTTFIKTGDKWFFLITNLLFVYDSVQDQMTELIDFNGDGLNCVNFFFDNENIIAVGEKEGDAAALNYSKDGTFIEEFLIGGEQEEKFLDGFIINNQIFLIGEKDSTSFDSPLLNVGLPNTKKVFVISCNKELTEVIDEIYFNQIDESESYQKLLRMENAFYLALNSCTLKLDYELNLLPQDTEVMNDLNHDNNVVLAKDKALKIVNDQGELSINNQYLADIEGTIASALVKNGNLVIYTIYGQNLNYYKISEYHIEKNQKITANRYNPEIDFRNKLIIKSFFEELKVEIADLNPTLPKNIDGIYQVNYRITKEDGKTFFIKGEYELKSFVNIVNDGVYPLQKELFFYGYATLNGKTIYNGYKIMNEGKYELKLINANNIETIYQFQVVDGYYKDDECVSINPDIIVNKDTAFKIIMDLNGMNGKKIERIWINGKSHRDFIIKNNQLIINMMSDSKYSVKNFHLDKIEYFDNGLKEYIINENYLVKTIKESPSITLNKEIRNQKIYLNFDFFDNDKTFNYLKTEIYDGSNLIGINYNYFNEEIKITSLDKINKVTVKHYLISFNGDATTSILLIDYEISDYHYEKLLKSQYEIDYKIDTLEMVINPTAGKIKKLTVGNQNLIKDLKIINHDLNTLVIIIVSVSIILIGLIVLVTWKNIKKRKELSGKNL